MGSYICPFNFNFDTNNSQMVHIAFSHTNKNIISEYHHTKNPSQMLKVN